jgi:hypothetical protein
MLERVLGANYVAFGNKITVDAVDSSVISDGDTMSIMGSDGKFVKYLIDGIADNVP